MIDHMTLTVRDAARSRAFYTKALAPLGYSITMEFGPMVGFGDARKPYLWLKQGDPPTTPMHVAFKARDRPSVAAFHAAAIEAGATDNGAPGIREHYHPDYYGAFVIDPDGHPIEAVCHAPEAKGAARGRAPARAAPKAPRTGATRRPAPKGARKERRR